MAKKDVLVKVTVNNSGLDFSDDVDFVLVDVPAEVKVYQVQNAIEKADQELRKEDDDGECQYNYDGWNTCTLMDEVCKNRDWTWSFLNPEISFTI